MFLLFHSDWLEIEDCWTIIMSCVDALRAPMWCTSWIGALEMSWNKYLAALFHGMYVLMRSSRSPSMCVPTRNTQKTKSKSGSSDIRSKTNSRVIFSIHSRVSYFDEEILALQSFECLSEEGFPGISSSKTSHFVRSRNSKISLKSETPCRLAEGILSVPT